MISTEGFVDNLDRQVRMLSEAASPSDVFKALLEGALLGAPRASIFLVRQGQLKGWGCIGYSNEAARMQRSFTAASETTWLDALVRKDAAVLEQSMAGVGPDFGQQPASQAVAHALRLKDRPIAVLMAERSSGEEPWQPPLIQALVRVALMRLDLDLLRRKLGGPRSEPARATVPLPGSGARTPDAGASGASKAAAPDDGEFDAARRYARLVATDIRLYNEEAVVQGRRNGDLVGRLGQQLKRGRETFTARHGDLGPAALEILRDAYVEVLAGGNAGLIPLSEL